MLPQPIRTKGLAIILSFLIVMTTAPFSWAETMAALPLGTVITAGKVTIGNAAAPTGTTIFAGDMVSSTEPALINFGNGSRIEMTKAAANFTLQGKTLVVQANQGLLRFGFPAGKQVQINAGDYKFTTVGNSDHIGELGLNRSGQVVLSVSKGAFTAFHAVTGALTEVFPNSPFVATAQEGQGTLLKGGNSITDSGRSFQQNELQGKCVVGGTEAYRIIGNAANVITINGAWKMNPGNYPYKVVECTRDAMMKAGASQEAANAAASVAASAGAVSGGGVGLTAAVIAGVAGAAGLGIGIHEATKSSSSR
jgi:hypothetical protein